MTTRKRSQAQQDSAASAAIPGLPVFPGLDVWREVMEGHAARFDAMLTEMERLERERHERTLTALDDVTSLVKSTLGYQQKLADEWRRLGREAARKSVEAFRA